MPQNKDILDPLGGPKPKHSTGIAGSIALSNVQGGGGRTRHGSLSALSNASSTNSHINSSLNIFGNSGSNTGYRDSQQPLNPPLTPTPSFTQLYPSIYNRRFSKDTICSSASSLYESNMALSHNGGGPGDSSADHAQQQQERQIMLQPEDTLSHTSSLFKSYDLSSDEEDESDTEDLVSRNGITITSKLPSLISNCKNRSLFKKNWDISGTTSPTFNGNGNSNSPSILSSPSSAQYFDQNTPIFKRIVSRNTVKPQLKSFRRVNNELFQESLPFENEINHENLILLNLKEEEDILNHHAMKRQVVIDARTSKEASPSKKKPEFMSPTNSQSSSANKFDIIRKANESWNIKKTMTSSIVNASSKLNQHKLSSPLTVRPVQPLTPLTPLMPLTPINRPSSPTNSHTSTATNNSQSTQLSTATNNNMVSAISYQQQTQQTASVMLSSFKNKRAFDTEEMTTSTTQGFKRRAVSTSPISSGYLKRSKDIKLISKTSNDLEKMSLG